MTGEKSFQKIYFVGTTAILEIDELYFIINPTPGSAGASFNPRDFRIEKNISALVHYFPNSRINLLGNFQNHEKAVTTETSLLTKTSKTYTTVAGAEILKGACIGLHHWQSDTVITPNRNEIRITSSPARTTSRAIIKRNREVNGFVLSVNDDKKSVVYITDDCTSFECIEDVNKRYDPGYLIIYEQSPPKIIGNFHVTLGMSNTIDITSVSSPATMNPLYLAGLKKYNEQDIKTTIQIICINQKLKISDTGLNIALEICKLIPNENRY